MSRVGVSRIPTVRVLVDPGCSATAKPLLIPFAHTPLQPKSLLLTPQAASRALTRAPLGHPDWCKQWPADFVTDLQPLFDAVSELASHDTKGAAQVRSG